MSRRDPAPRVRPVADKRVKSTLLKAIRMALRVESAAVRHNTQTFNRSRYHAVAALPDYDALKGSFVIDVPFMRRHPHVTLMHPLPRVDEIAAEVDDFQNAAYFRQAQNGLYVRMAVLALVLGQRA